jgi:translation initiation factor IF-2
MGKTKDIIQYPPVVAVLGHVDHGKTTLLDAIRKTNIAQREHGGITQKIGASTIEIEHEGNKRKITFIDTPGHEAFSKMRGRGAQAADIGLLIISAVDGVMPQTRESILLLKASKIPFIVVLTKSDSPEKNSEKVRQQLLKEEVMLENFGGDVPSIEVSAKTGSNVRQLLDLILLAFDLYKESGHYKLSENNNFEGVIIESRLDPKSGSKVTAIVKNGIINVRDEVVAENAKGKVKNLISDNGKQVEKATVGEAVEILGFESVPAVGSIVYKKDQLKEEVKIQEEEKVKKQEGEDFLSIILCADTQGSLEAIINSLPQNINIILKKTGDIEASDIFFAKSVGAIVLGFNIKLKPEVVTLAKTEKVILKGYTIIYEMINEISDFVQGKLESLQEEILGIAKVLARFPYEKTEVLGISVTEGRVAKGDKVRVLRGEEVIGESYVSSVRQGKEQISKVESGQQAGMILAPRLDFTIGDVVICHG